MKNKKELKLYDFSKNFNDNFMDDEDKHIVIKISKKDNEISVLPDPYSFCVSEPNKLIDINELKYMVWDYDTIFGVRYNIFKLYNHEFFDCQEIVFFNALLIKFKRNKFKQFRWEKTKIGYELKINRRKLNSMIKKFKELGIIKSTVCKSHKFPIKGVYANATYFKLDCDKIYELLPKILSEFDYEKMEGDLYRYLAPTLKKKDKEKGE
ncbi:hypothetical protein [Tenacibaculum maritimum]|uniref:hypothetical protein n=1 Tax=Tenacibaculum maritimum TaxID=107401 RepID=UPI00387648CB